MERRGGVLVKLPFPPTVNPTLLAMAAKTSLTKLGSLKLESKPKKTRQGCSLHTKLSASSRNGRKKRYKGQGR